MKGLYSKPMAKHDKDVQNLIDIYNRSDNVEFEMRARIYVESFKLLLDAYKDNPYEISQSLNIIAHGLNKINRIRTVEFNCGKKSSERYSTKKQLNSVELGGIFNKCAISEEHEMAPFKTPTANIYRYKWRVSITLEEWRVDMTISKEISNAADIVRVAREFFPEEEMTIANMLSHMTDKIELELEFVGDELTMESVKKIQGDVTNIIRSGNSNPEYQNTIHEVAKLMVRDHEKFRHRFGLKQLGNQVHDLTKNKISAVSSHLDEYWITDKADGERAVVYVTDVIRILTSTIETRPLEKVTVSPIVADCEYIDGTIYVFDVMVFDKLVADEPFEERLKLVDKVAKIIGGLSKKFVYLGPDVAAAKKAVAEFKVYTKSRPYTCDGYILTPNLEYYNTATYKVKFPEYLSIDFLVMPAPQSVVGIDPYVKKKDPLHFLFSGISRAGLEKYRLKRVQGYDEIFADFTLGDYVPIQFAPSSNPFAYVYYMNSDIYDGPGIYEMRMDVGGWRILRKRTDRDIELKRGNYYGNNFDIAEQIWESYKNPIAIDDIYDVDESYFREHDNPLYKEMRRFNSHVKSVLIGNLKGRIIDMGSGKGQDIQRYRFAEDILFIDNDINALQELVNRKKTMKGSRGVHVLHADLTKSHVTLVAETSKLGFARADHIVCNFAIHYLVTNAAAINNLVAFIKSSLIPNGTFTYTCFDGKKIIELLKNGDWDVYVDTVLKYSIRKRYKTNRLGVGQKIDVLLPFSSGEYYTEYLVDIENTNEVFVKNGFKVVSTTSFDEYFNDETRLDANDQEFVSLYTSVVLQRAS